MIAFLSLVLAAAVYRTEQFFGTTDLFAVLLSVAALAALLKNWLGMTPVILLSGMLGAAYQVLIWEQV